MHHQFFALVAVDEPALPSATGVAGPGWYESSWDLRRGLEVDENFESDTSSQWRRRPLQAVTAPAFRRVADHF